MKAAEIRELSVSELRDKIKELESLELAVG